MSRLRIALLFLLPAVPSWAQTANIQPADLSHGATLPPTSAALVDEATAPLVNPAGLGLVSGFQLFYVHERNPATDQIADGLYFAENLFGILTPGFAIEWLRGHGSASGVAGAAGGPSRRRFTWSLAAGSPLLSLGAAYHVFSSGNNADLDALSSWDVGLASRPSRYFALGIAVQNVDRPSHGAIAFNRRYDFALGLRPIGDRYTLAVDYLLNDAIAGSSSRMQYTLQAQVLNGLVLGAGLSHGFNGENVLFQGSITLNASRFGLTYAGGGSSAGGDHVVMARLSSRKYPAFTLAPDKFAVLDLPDLLSKSSSPLAFLGFTEADPYLRLTRLLDNVARDPNLKGLVLRIEMLPHVGLGKAMELRQAILRLRGSGKKVVAVLLSAGDTEYLLASAADQIYTVPEAQLLINGFAANALFVGTAMEKLGVQWEVARVGAYKNAPDLLTRSDMSPEQRETVNAYLDTDVRNFRSAVMSSRQLSSQQLDQVWAEGLIPPRAAKEMGLVDDVISLPDLEEKLRQLLPGAHFDRRYRPRDVKEMRWGQAPQIAVVPVIGTIANGKSQEDPLGLIEVAGAQTVVRALRRAQEDPGVAAIVVRVDSGGGDGLASDLIYRAVLDAKKRKPVIASMGDVAASGGYYAAMGADQIFASPTTITGSIGVFFLKPVAKNLAEKLGVHHETIRRGELSNLTSLLDPWTPKERAAAQKWVNAFYDSFITEVAASRKLTKDQVDAIARGRVWSGEDAKARGLVDEMGGLLEAIAGARRRAHIPDREQVEIAIIGEARGLLAAFGEKDGLLADALGDRAQAQPLSPAIRALAGEIGLDQVLLLEPTIKAMMPFTLQVH
jgi:protease-4